MEYLDETLEEMGVIFLNQQSSERSYLVNTVNRLTKKRIRDFTVEDLRLMIGQNIGIDILMPIAIYKLETNPFLEGDYYPGDLLVSILECSCKYCKDHPSFKIILDQILAVVKIQINDRDDLTHTIIERMMKLIFEYESCIQSIGKMS